MSRNEGSQPFSLLCFVVEFCLGTVPSHFCAVILEGQERKVYKSRKGVFLVSGNPKKEVEEGIYLFSPESNCP